MPDGLFVLGHVMEYLDLELHRTRYKSQEWWAYADAQNLVACAQEALAEKIMQEQIRTWKEYKNA